MWKPVKAFQGPHVEVYSFHFESPQNYLWLKKTTLQMGPKVDLTMTFKAGSDIFRPFYFMGPSTRVQNVSAAGKSYLLLWLVSNCQPKARNQLFKELQRRLGPNKVHQYGHCKGAKRVPCPSALAWPLA